MTSDLIPARKHPSFAANALASAGAFTVLVFFAPERYRSRVAGALGILLTGLALGDMIYMRYFGGVIPSGSLVSTGQLWDVRRSIESLFEARDVKLLPLLVAAFAILFLPGAQFALSRKRLLAVYLLPILACSYACVVATRDVDNFLHSKWAKEVLNREDNVWNAGFLLAHVRELALLIKTVLEQHPLTTEQIAQTRKYFQSSHVEEPPSAATFARCRGCNVIVVQVEALESWVVDARISGQEVTPALNAMKTDSTFYPDVFDQVGSASTSDCEYLVMTANHPLPDTAVAFRRANNEFSTLASVLRQHGFHTLSMHAYRRGMWNRALLHPRYGFVRSFFENELGNKPQIGWGLDDHVFFEHALPILHASPKPYFSFLITLTSHHPYNVIEPNKRRLRLGQLENTMVGHYLHAVHYVDHALGQFVEGLRISGALENTLLVVYGDHDAHLKIDARTRSSLADLLETPQQPQRFSGPAGWPQERVPLFFRLPNAQREAGISTLPAGQINIGPSVLHYLGIKPPPSFLGRALQGRERHRVSRWDGSWASEKFIYNAQSRQCLAYTTQQEVPTAHCDAQTTAVAEELKMSWRLTNHDLAGAINTTPR
ncbi:MAG: LTA synthase family protein [Myxococcota bacterium]